MGKSRMQYFWERTIVPEMKGQKKTLIKAALSNREVDELRQIAKKNNLRVVIRQEPFGLTIEKIDLGM